MPPRTPRQFFLQTLGALLAVVIALVLAGESSAQSYRSIPMADGFDYPVGIPNADGYYKHRGFYPNAHMGDDWNGNGGGNTDLGDPVYAMGNGLCVYSQNYGSSWGNLIILRHAYREKNGRVYYIDSVYAHLDRRNVAVDKVVSRGEVIGTIGTAGGIYTAHLHFEVRKNLAIGPWQSVHDKTYANYHSPTHFINANRNLRRESRQFQVPVNTFSKSRTPTSNVASSASGTGGATSGRMAIPTHQTSRTASRPQAPAQVRTVIENQTGDRKEDSGGFWQRFKSRLGFGRNE